jgi:hypothetical protein
VPHSGEERSFGRTARSTNAIEIKLLESLGIDLKVQTNIEVGLDLNENLYQRFPFIFHDLYQGSKITFNLKLLF